MRTAGGVTAAIGLLAAAALGAAGCGYSTQSLHPEGVRTVMVPTFASQELRRNLEFDLTRELVRTIEARTPYKVVSDRSRADTELRGEVMNFSAPVLAENVDTDAPLSVQVSVTCWFEWKDLRTGEVLARRDALSANANYATAFGQNEDSATDAAMQRLAVLIVEAMEKEW